MLLSASAAVALSHSPEAIAGNESSEEPRQDGDRALAAGRFEEALPFYLVAIERDGEDRRALREAGRTAFALRKPELAAELLRRARELTTRPDPEVDYLLGEALWTLGRAKLAKQAHERALSEIGSPQQRVEKLWVARIHSRLGDRDAADAIYEAMIEAAPADAEPALAQVEMHAAAAEWVVAEYELRRFLDHAPTHTHALELLAWVLEGRGKLDEEIRLRKTIAQGSERVETVRDYGRALERSGDWAGALATYQRAQLLPDGDKDLELARALQRVDERMSVELAAGTLYRTDPNASGIAGFAGVAAPFGHASHLSLVSLHELAHSADRDVYAGELRAATVLRGHHATAVAGGEIAVLDLAADPVQMMPRRQLFAPGAFAQLSSGIDPVTISVDGELGALWRDTPRAVFEGGRSDAVTSHIYVKTLGDRLVFDSGAQARRLRMTAETGSEPRAQQLLGWSGADLRVWSNFASEARGQILDDQLLHPTFAADSAVVSYRHYELFGATDPMFAARMSLAGRASIDELSATARKVMAHGAVAVEAQGGFGRDWARDLYLWRGGGALWLSPSARSRLSLSFDVARESVHAFAGERRTGWVNYHVDL